MRRNQTRATRLRATQLLRKHEFPAPRPAETPPPESPGTYAWLILMKAHRSLMKHAEASFEALNIGLTDFVILEMLLHKGPQKVSDIGRRVGLTSGAITAAVDRSEQQGLVVRTLDPEDRRARVVKLTPPGRAVIGQAFTSHSDAMEDAMSVLTQSELRTLAKLLKRVGTAVQSRQDRVS